MVLEIFETRKIKTITLQWQASYDPAGRYSPTNANRYFINLGASLVGRRPKFIGWFDAVGFIKAPIAQAKSDDYDDRHIMPNIKDYPLVTNGPNTPCLLYTSPSPRDRQKSRMPSSA